jgi:hypothetical protein
MIHKRMKNEQFSIKFYSNIVLTSKQRHEVYYDIDEVQEMNIS